MNIWDLNAQKRLVSAALSIGVRSGTYYYADVDGGYKLRLRDGDLVEIEQCDKDRAEEQMVRRYVEDKYPDITDYDVVNGEVRITTTGQEIFAGYFDELLKESVAEVSL